MLEKFKVWLRSPIGRTVTAVFVVLVAVYLFVTLRSEFGNDPGVATNSRVFIDGNTGQIFRVEIADLKTIPCETPAGTKTGYPAEACFWTKDGGTKNEPTYVFVKEYAGSREPTYCPDCGRLVVQLNPGPMPGRKPPRTKDGR